MGNTTKQMQALHVTSIRELVSEANLLGLQREDIVGTHQVEDGYFLIYYK